VLYASGHNVIQYQADTKQQKFLAASNDSDCITAITVSPNKKLLAVAEKSEKAIISIYDLQTLKRRKTLVSAETGSKVCFPDDYKIHCMLVPYMLWLHGAPILMCSYMRSHRSMLA
jgi:WD40 repeat protein